MEPGPTPTLMRVGARVDQRLGAFAGRDVAADDVDVRGRRVGLEPADDVEHACATGRSRCRRRARRRRRRPAPSARSQASPKKPMAAPTRSRPSSSLVAMRVLLGLVEVLDRDEAARACPRRRPAAASRSCAWRAVATASSRAMPTGRGDRAASRVMTSRTRRVVDARPAGTNRMSRLVMMPSSVPSRRRPAGRRRGSCRTDASSSASVASGPSVTGSVIMPDSLRLTRSTWCGLVLDGRGCGAGRRCRPGGPWRWPCGTR